MNYTAPSKLGISPKNLIRYLLVVSVFMTLYVLMHNTPAHAAACSAPATDYGSVTSSIQIDTAGTYRVQSRIMAPDTTNNSYLLEIDGNTCFTVGDAAIAANTWTWVDYQNGTASSKIDITLGVGNHTVKMIGREPDVKVDRVMFLADAACPITGTGDNCAVNRDTAAPTTSITAPANAATVSGTTTISATATDDIGVTKVELWVDGAISGAADTTFPYQFSWNTTTATNGAHSLTTKAYDAAGNITTSAPPVSVTVNNAPVDTAPPVTSITPPPASGAVLAGTTTISATATDDIGVTKVELWVDGAISGAADTTFPYQFSWNTTTATNGAHSLTTKAYDASGKITTSAAVSVTVDNQAPTVSINPLTNTFLSGNSNIINVTANDNVAVAKVEILIDGTVSNNPDFSAPYVFSWDTTTIANGAHTLAARATDTAGTTTTTAVINVTVDNQAPAITMDSPAANEFLSHTKTVSATATDNTGVTKVEFYVDGAQYGSADTTAPYQFNWDTTTATNGAHSLTVKAYDAAGKTTTTTAVSVTVDNLQPTVSISAPANNASVSGNAVAINATANDTGGSGVNRVEFYRGTNLLNTDTTTPYNATWDTTAIANGSYSLTAKVYDGAGNMVTSAAVTVTVNNVVVPPPDTTKPTVSFNSPSNNATVTGSVNVVAISGDNVGVTKVEFYIDSATTAAYTATTAPYSYTWNSTSVADGSHTIKAIAYDAANNSQTATVTVTVNNTPVAKPGDANGDGHVTLIDLSVLLSNYSRSGATRAQGDMNGDSVVNLFDLSILLTNYGT